MKTTLTLVLLLLFLGKVYGQSTKNEEVIYDNPDKKAYYSNFERFLAKNLRYPQTAIENNLQGSCEIEFVVHCNGKLSDFIVIKGMEGCSECNEEAIRILKKSNKWSPALVDGKSVSSRYSVSIKFSLM